MLIWQILKRYTAKSLAREIAKSLPQNSVVYNEKLTLMDNVSEKVGELLDSVEIFLNATDEVMQEEVLRKGMLPIGDKENSILKARYDYVPSIIPHDIYLKYSNRVQKRNNGSRPEVSEKWFTSRSAEELTHARNFETADRRFAGTLISEGHDVNSIKIVDFKPEIHLLKTLGYLSEDEKVFYPMLKVGDLVKVINKIGAPKVAINSSTMFPGPPMFPEEKRNLIDENDPSWKALPLFRDIEAGEAIMYLGFRKLVEKKSLDKNQKRKFFNLEYPLAKVEEIVNVSYNYTAEWILDGRVMSGIFLITSLEKMDTTNEK